MLRSASSHPATTSRSLPRKLYAFFATAMAGLICLALIAPSPAQAAPPADMATEALRTNSLTNPLGISTDDPVIFSWQNTSSGRGVSQTDYEIQVASTADKLAAGDADLWATGRVASADQLNVQYDGAALEPQTEYFWHVRTWNDSGERSAWSDPATFETALTVDQWDAQWIGGPSEADRLAKWADYTVSVDFSINFGAFGLYFRAPNGANAYMWQVSTSGDKPLLRPHVKSGGGFPFFTDVSLPEQFTNESLENEVHNLKVTVAGNSIITFLDDIKIDERPRGEHAAGYIGFRQDQKESANIYGVKVTNSADEVLLDTDFKDGSNPFTAGQLIEGGQGGLLVAGAEALFRAEASQPLLRSGFDVAAGKTVTQARLYASARGVYKAFVNGEKVGDEELAPGWTDYNKRIQYQTYDVTDHVKSGDNAIGFMLADGWYAGHIASFGTEKYGTYNSLVAMMRIDFSDGTSQWVKTGSDWNTATGPLVESDMIMGERYDASLERTGWDNAGFDDSAWEPVGVAPTDVSDKLLPQTDEPVRVTQTLDALERTENPSGVWIYDMGQNMVGVANVELTGKAGQTVMLRHGEVLNPDGTLYTANLRSAKATDYYTFAADGTVTFSPHFTFHGYRYLEISGVDTPPELEQVKGLVWGTDLERTGSLETSSAMLNQLQSNILWGQRGNFLSIPTDTPARDERLGWTGDINVFAPTATRNQGVLSFLSKWLVDLEDNQKADGALPGVAPFTGCCQEFGTGWADAGVTVPYALWYAYGDLEVLRNSYSMMTKFMDKLESDAGSALIRDNNFWGDWLHLGDNTSGGVLGTAYFAYDAQLMSEMAAALGKTADADRYAQLATDVKAAFAAKFIAEDGTVLGNSQTGYAMAIGMGLVPDDQLEAVGAKFVAKVASRDYHLSTGFLGTPWLLPALSKAGYHDVAYRLLNNEDYPSWGYEIANGATTIWERWNSIMPDGSFGDVNMNSFNHYAYGAVGDWMYQYIGGIQPTSAGYKTFNVSIDDERGGLESGKASYESVYGTITSSWADAQGGITLDVQVPVSTTATVSVPSLNGLSVTEGGKPLAGRDDIDIVSEDNGQVTVKVGSGTYAFSSDPANAGMTASISGEGDIQPGTTVTGKLVVKNTSSETLTDLVAKLKLADGSPVTLDPTTLTLDKLAAGDTKELAFTAKVPAGTPAGKVEVFAELSANVNGAPYSFSIRGQVANVVATLTVSVDKVQVLEGDPGPAAIVSATAKNTAKLPVTGHFEVSTPAGWKAAAPSRDVQLPAGGAGSADVYVPIPLTVTADAQKVEIRFVSDGRSLGKASDSIAVTLADPPEATIDHVDFGETSSESEHAVASSGNGGVTMEAGRSRRYSGLNTPGTWFSADVKVPAEGAFIIRGVETFDQQQVKSYDIYINDVVVHSRLYERTETGTGLKTFQVLVDGDTLESLQGPGWDPDNVTVKFMYNGKGSHDPSLADIWILGTPVVAGDEEPPVVTFAATNPGKNGWHLAGAQAVLTASDLGSGVKSIEYSTGGNTWRQYLSPVDLAEGTTTFAYRATDNADNTSEPKSAKIPVDATPPVATVALSTKPVNGAHAAGTTATVTATDAHSGVDTVECSLDGAKTWSVCGKAVVLIKGDNTLSYRATDKAGNVSKTATLTVKVLGVPNPVPLKVTRYSGNDRYGTSLKLAKETMVAGKPLFVASGAAFADSLAVGGAVHKQGGTLLLTGATSMNADMLALISARKPSIVYVIGGGSSVSKAVADQLKRASGAPIERVYGDDRYETSAKILETFYLKDKGFTSGSILIAAGGDFPDALTASSASGAMGAPLLIVDGKNAKKIPASLLASIKAKGVTQAVVIGGTASVNDSVGKALSGAGLTLDRKSGPTRYATNMAVNAMVDSVTGAKPGTVWLASGANFPDALSAAPLAAQAGHRLYLSQPTCLPAGVLTGVIKGSGSLVKQVNLVGGEKTLDQKNVGSLTGVCR